MTPYGNLSGNSGVSAFQIGHESISVCFRGNQCYEYTYDGIGRENVETMKELASCGRGLNTFISQTPKVRNGYTRKWTSS